MTIAPPWTRPTQVVQLPEPEVVEDLEGYALSRSLISLVQLAYSTDARSRQVEIGSSEIGWACPRRVAYRLAGTPRVNDTDPMKLMLGSGLHLYLAEKFRVLDPQDRRFLIEYPCVYRDVPGHGDLYDRFTRTVIDWKSTSKARINEMRKKGVPGYYSTQVQHNAMALRAQGEDVQAVALMFFPTDSTLTNAWAWVSKVDPRVADEAVDRINQLRGSDPASVACVPDRFCGWCAHYKPGSTDLSVACDAKKGSRT